MKRLLTVALAILFVASSPALARADGAATASCFTWGDMRQCTISVGFDATTALFTAQALNSIASARAFTGWYLNSIEYEYGVTGPTDNSDLYLYRETANRTDILGGEGANALDNAADSIIYPATLTPLLTGGELLTLSGNSVSGATATLRFNLHR